MRNIIRTALIVGTLATPMISMADAPKKDAPAKMDPKADAPAKMDPKADAPKADAPKADAPKADKKADKAKKDVKAPATPAPAPGK
jgi:hypothetical protein